MIRFLKKYKIVACFLFVIIFMLPFTIYEPAESDRIAVVTSIGVDKDSEGFELSLNVITPSNQSSTSGGTMGMVKTFSGKGENITTALSNVSLSMGKTVGLAHCDSIIVSKEVLQDDVAKILDYFVRSNNLTNNTHVFVADKKAKDIIKAAAQERSNFALTLSNIINYNQMFSLSKNTNVDNFFIDYFSKSGVGIIPVLSSGPEDKSVSTHVNTNGDNSKQNSSAESQNSSQQEKQGEQSKPNNEDVVKNEGKVVVIKKGKMVCELTNDQIATLNLLSNKTKKGYITAKNITNKVFENADLTYEIHNKTIGFSAYFIKDVPVFNIDISLILQIKEVVTNNEKSYMAINGTTAFLTDDVKTQLKKTTHNHLSSIINLMKEKQVDILRVYQAFNKHETKKWNNYLANLKNQEDFLSNVVFTVNINPEGKI